MKKRVMKGLGLEFSCFVKLAFFLLDCKMEWRVSERDGEGEDRIRKILGGYILGKLIKE